MSEGKCHDKSDHSKWASQKPNKVKARVIPSKVNRAVTIEQSIDLSPAGSQIEKNSETEDD